jgi:hypothetical protein
MRDRIYTVTDTLTGAARLIRATKPSVAIQHAAQRFTATIATQDELVDLMGAGVLVELAGHESPLPEVSQEAREAAAVPGGAVAVGEFEPGGALDFGAPIMISADPPPLPCWPLATEASEAESLNETMERDLEGVFGPARVASG